MYHRDELLLSPCSVWPACNYLYGILTTTAKGLVILSTAVMVDKAVVIITKYKSSFFFFNTRTFLLDPRYIPLQKSSLDFCSGALWVALKGRKKSHHFSVIVTLHFLIGSKIKSICFLPAFSGKISKPSKPCPK